MDNWHLLIAAHVILMPIGQYLGKVFIHKIHAFQILFYQYIASIITISIYIPLFTTHTIVPSIPWWSLLIGFMYALGVASLYLAKKQSLSKTGVMSNGINIFAIIFIIIFLGEYTLIDPTTPTGTKKGIGLILMIIAIIMFYRKKMHEGSEKTFNYLLWVRWMTVGIGILGVANVIVKYAVDLYHPLQVLQLQYIGSFIIIALLCVLNKKTIFVGWRNIWGSIAIGGCISTGLATLYTALSLSTATQVFAIVSVAITITVTLFGVVFFKERITKRMILPFVLGIISMYLLK